MPFKFFYVDPIPFIPLAKNLIDEIWTESNGRPPNNKEPAYVYPEAYSGRYFFQFICISI